MISYPFGANMRGNANCVPRGTFVWSRVGVIVNAEGGGLSGRGLHQGGGGICTPSSSYAKMFQKMAKRRKVMKEKTMTHQEHCFCRLSS